MRILAEKCKIVCCNLRRLSTEVEILFSFFSLKMPKGIVCPIIKIVLLIFSLTYWQLIGKISKYPNTNISTANFNTCGIINAVNYVNIIYQIVMIFKGQPLSIWNLSKYIYIKPWQQPHLLKNKQHSAVKKLQFKFRIRFNLYRGQMHHTNIMGKLFSIISIASYQLLQLIRWKW